jgi:hypothetical protein
MKVIERTNIKPSRYAEAIEAIGKLSGDNALELKGMEYDSVISLRTLIWAKYGSGAYNTRYNKSTKEMVIWKA